MIANAGINEPARPIGDFSPDDFRALMDVNVVSALSVLAEATRRVRGGRAIIALTTSLVRQAVAVTGPWGQRK